MNCDMKKYINIIMIAASLAAVSCTKNFLDRNTNQEEATDEMLTHDNLTTGSAFAQMTKNVIPTYQTTGSEEYGTANYQIIDDLAGNMFAGYISPTNTGFSQNNFYNLNNDGWCKAMFNDAYTRLMGSWTELNKQREEFPEIAALADIVKIACMHRITDSYGPIPYSEVGSGAVTLAYDSQEAIYKSFFEELDNAITILTNFYEAQPSTKILENFDQIYSGNVGSWVKFANTLRLRLATRVSYVDEALYKAQAEAAINNSVGLMEEANDIAKFNKPNSGSWEYPIYIIQYSFNDAAIGATFETYLNGFNDPRISNYCTIGSDNAYHGVRAGVTLNANYKSSTLLSHVNCTNNDDVPWMVPAEAWFLKAEYYLRTGDDAQAQECYEQGIRVAFETVGASGVDAYITDETSTPGSFTDVVNSSNSYRSDLSDTPIAWSAVSSFENHLEQIITQKWIAMFPIGQEAWSEFRRTGYPSVIPFSVNNSSGGIDTQKQIRRLIYPAEEYRNNAENVTAGIVTLNGESAEAKGDKGGTRLWWDKNDL